MYHTKFVNSIAFKKVFMWSFILPFIAIIAGWIVSEVGRQPWTVNGLLLTSESVSTGVPTAAVAFSLITTTLLYLLVFVVVIMYLITQVKNPIEEIKYLYEVEEKDE
jgi:cytochrome d ubiquinol oxidase subunit I